MRFFEVFLGLIYFILVIFLVITKNISFIPYNFYIVQSGSMEPIIKVADLIVVNKKNDYFENEIITYNDVNNSIVTHRIVKKENKNFETKGDANREQDRQTVIYEQIIGKVVLNIPLVGYFLSFVKTKFGIFLFIIIPFLYIVIFEFKNLKYEKH